MAPNLQSCQLPSDSIQFGSGNASLNPVEAKSWNTLPVQADSLTILGTKRVARPTGQRHVGLPQGEYDTLVSGAGEDTLGAESATAPDTLVAGSGGDSSLINDGSDVITNAASTANYSIQSSVATRCPRMRLPRPHRYGKPHGRGKRGGPDTISANAGNDTLIFDSGFGNDLVLNAQDDDVLEFSSGISRAA